MIYVMFCAGLIALVAGGEILIRGALGAARRLNVSSLLAGLTIVGFGTSAPELVVSLDAAIRGEPAIAIGNIVGSNIGNTLLILGICAVIYPLAVKPEVVRRDGVVMMASTVLFILLTTLTGTLALWHGILFLGVLAAYVGYTYWSETRRDTQAAAMHQHEAEEIGHFPVRSVLIGLYVIGGLILLVTGARLVVSGAMAIAVNLGISEAVIGLTLVAVGTSLPELTVSVIAAVRRHADVAIGNILGSNIFNLLGILGTAAVAAPLPVIPRIAEFDQWVMLGVSVLLIIFLVTGWRINRLEGAAFLGGYGVYVAYSLAGN